MRFLKLLLNNTQQWIKECIDGFILNIFIFNYTAFPSLVCDVNIETSNYTFNNISYFSDDNPENNEGSTSDSDSNPESNEDSTSDSNDNPGNNEDFNSNPYIIF